MSNVDIYPTVDELRRLFHYDPETGVFTRQVTTSGRGRAGTRADILKPDGYRYIHYKANWILAHRLAWFYVHGILPVKFLDHVNIIRDDNRLFNLREVDHSGNAQNVKGAQKNNLSCGLRGVSYYRPYQRWMARLYVAKKFIWCGYHDTAQEAYSAYCAAKLKYHPFQTMVPDGLEL